MKEAPCLYRWVSVNGAHRIVTVNLATGILLINKHSLLNTGRISPAPVIHSEEQFLTTTAKLHKNALSYQYSHFKMTCLSPILPIYIYMLVGAAATK